MDKLQSKGPDEVNSVTPKKSANNWKLCIPDRSHPRDLIATPSTVISEETLSQEGFKEVPITEASTKTNDWKINIFMAADNNLSEESIWAIQEIKNTSPKVILETNIHLMTRSRVIFIEDGSGQNQTGRGENPKPIEDYDNNKRTLIENFIIENGPFQENKSVLILSGHGNGALGDFLSGDKTNTNNPLGIKETGTALKNGLSNSKFDILGLDSCLMGMIEVCYELREHAKYIVAHQGYERNTGWPYFDIITSIDKNCTKNSPREIAVKIVEQYINYYSSYKTAGVSVDIATCDLSKFNEHSGLVKAIKKLVKSLISGLDNQEEKIAKDILDATILAHWKAQSYNNEQYVDLWDFCYLLCKQLEGAATYQEIYESANDVMKNINGTYFSGNKLMKDGGGAVLISCYSGPAFQHSHGLSIYFPWERSAVDNELKQYNNLEFAKTTRWGDFLKKYLIRSQREARQIDTHGPSYKEGAQGRHQLIRIPLTDFSETEVRSNPKLNTRSNPELNTKGGINIGIWVKNHCDTYYEYDSECDISKLNTPGGT
ncbi:MAG: hypothetical protein IPM55_05850 [Acidobacteria bacterium]|nr:hypothetical protein [Acidobacteriota bacterium]